MSAASGGQTWCGSNLKSCCLGNRGGTFCLVKMGTRIKADAGRVITEEVGHSDEVHMERSLKEVLKGLKSHQVGLWVGSVDRTK